MGSDPASHMGSRVSQPRVDRFAFQRQDTEDGLVDVVERVTVDESLQRLQPQGELVQRQVSLLCQ